MSSGCLCNPYWAVVLPDRHGIGWQSLSNIFYRHLCYGPGAPVQSSLGSWPAKMSRHCVARGIQLFSIGLWAMCTVQCGCSVIGRCSASVPLRLQAKWVHATVVQLVFLYGEVGEVSGDQSTYFTYFQQFHHQIVSDGGT